MCWLAWNILKTVLRRFKVNPLESGVDFLYPLMGWIVFQTIHWRRTSWKCSFWKIYIYQFIFLSLEQMGLSCTWLFIQNQPQEVFCKKGVLKNVAKCTGRHLCQSLFFNKVSGLRPQIFRILFYGTLLDDCFC